MTDMEASPPAVSLFLPSFAILESEIVDISLLGPALIREGFLITNCIGLGRKRFFYFAFHEFTLRASTCMLLVGSILLSDINVHCA